MKLTPAQLTWISGAALCGLAALGLTTLGAQPQHKPASNTVIVARAPAPQSDKPVIGTGSDIFPWCPPICPRDGGKK